MIALYTSVFIGLKVSLAIRACSRVFVEERLRKIRYDDGAFISQRVCFFRENLRSSYISQIEGKKVRFLKEFNLIYFI